ncbi:hypothetical protein F4802DRAFT_552776 [Xylaria palmicola]|nr:hypothetical protein F4802DRAFT_552776 [Xylaria palmicola]
MARRPSFLQFLIWTSSLPIASSRSLGLGGDIASLVPTCAQPCLTSFIRSNYPTVDCGGDFTLPCLCPTQSISGFTIGEAALQCLFGYIQLGQCDEKDVDGAAPPRVLHMCSGHTSALPNTHSTLTATLVVPPSGAPILLPPTSAKMTPSASSTTTSLRTTSRTSTSTPTHITNSTSSSASITRATSSSRTSSRTSSPASSTTSSPASSPTSSPTSVPNSIPTSSSTPIPVSAASSAGRLSPGQIAGISVGVAGAVAIAVGAIFLARCLRRRRYPDSDSEAALFANDNNRDSFEPLGSNGSQIFHISPPVLRTSRYRPDFGPRPAPAAPQTAQPDPPIQSSNMDRNTIGLAISRPRSFMPQKLPPRTHSPAMSSPRLAEAPLERKPSRLLPPRPALTIDIPSKTVASYVPSSQGPLTKDRASTLTNMTGFADIDSEAPEGEQTWRPPPTDPMSATTLYVADKYGNWVLSKDNRRSQIAQIIQPAELDTYTPLTKSPIEKQEDAAKMAGAISAAAMLPGQAPPAFLSQDPANKTYSQSSSLYSQASSARQNGRRSSVTRNSASRFRKSNGTPSINRSDSKASVTTIQTSSTGGIDDEFTYESDVARLSQLSPVKELPSPATGRSRVTYPKIPGRLDGATIRFVPPPKRPNFAGMPLGQPSPTLGALYPREGSPSAYPLPLNPRRNERRFAPTQRTGSGFTPEPPNVEVYPFQNYEGPNNMPRSGPYPRFDPKPLQPEYRYADPRQQDPFRTPTSQPDPAVPTFTPSPPSADKRSLTPLQTGIMDRGRPRIATERVVSDTSFRTVSSNASSLLAKRIGSDKAAALALDPNGTKPQQWKRGSRDGRLISLDAFSLASPRGTLPQTPTWQPKLTPTRRGDDLYLNVQ